jgi:hypothetical protein
MMFSKLPHGLKPSSVDTICYLASNKKREDIAALDLSPLNIDAEQHCRFHSKEGSLPPN